MKHIWLKGVMMGAAVICGAMDGFANDWTYTDGTISDGNWGANVTWEEGSNELTFKCTYTNYVGGSTTLDLRDMVVNGTAITKLKIIGSNEAKIYRWNTPQPAGFMANHLVSLSTLFKYGTSVGPFWIEGDELEAIPDGFLSGVTLTGEVTIKCPNLKSLGSNAFRSIAAITNITVLCPPCVTNIGQYALTGNGNDHTAANYARGKLVVTNLCGLGSYAFQNARMGEYDLAGGIETIPDNAFNSLYHGYGVGLGATNVVLKFPKLKTIGATAFNSCTILKRLEIHSKVLESIGEKAFLGCMSLKELVLDVPSTVQVATNVWDGHWQGKASISTLWMWNDAPSAEVLDTLVFTLKGSDTTKPCTIYCSKKFSGWAALGEAHPVTEAEKAYMPEGCFGVYVTAAGERKAWLVKWASPNEPQGLCIRIQ